jgi:butyryl-CoA dehydrogenase
MIRDALRSFSQERLAPNAARWDREQHFPKDELKELAQLGAFGVAVPEQYGGAGLDYVSLALVLEEIAAGDGGTSTIISVNNCPVCSIAMMYANEAQKEQWLRPLAQGEMLGAFASPSRTPAATPPPCAPRQRAMATTTSSTAPSSSSPAARTATSPSSWPSPTRPPARRASAPSGCRPIRPATSSPASSTRWASTRRTRRRSCSRTAASRLANLIGEEGQGYKIALSGLEGGRIGIASQSVGMARAAFEAALAYAKERESFGTRSSTTRPCSSAWPRWRCRSRPRAS